MSYNIDSWETIVLSELRIPINVFDEDNIEWDKDNAVWIDMCEDGGIEGVAVDGWVHVSKIYLRATGSGSAKDDLNDILKSSTGELRAFLTWEGGDSFSVLHSRDGDVSDEDADPVAMLKRIAELEIELKRCHESASS